MTIDRFYYEVKLMGMRVILTPILVVLGFCLLALLLTYLKVGPARALLAGVEMMLPLAAGAVVGMIVAQDPSLELQLTVPRRYHLTGMLRVGLILAWTMCVSLLDISGIAGLKMLYLPEYMVSWSPVATFFLTQLLWFAPLLFCVGIGFCFSLLMQSRTAAVALLGGLWVAEIVFKDLIGGSDLLRPFFLFPATLGIYPATNATADIYNKYVLTTRYEILGMAVLFLFLGWLLLRRPERMLKGVSEE